MAQWTATSPTRARMVFGRWAWVGAIPFLLMVISFMIGGLPRELPVIFGWAVGSTLAWVALFTRHQIEIDKNRGLLIHSLRSVYPIARLELPLDQIAGFCVTNTPFERRRYNLIVITADGQRICLLRKGGLGEREEQGKQLADFCQLPYLREAGAG